MAIIEAKLAMPAIDTGAGRVTQSQIRNNQNKIEATDYRYKDPPAALRSQDYMTSGNILISPTPQANWVQTR